MTESNSTPNDVVKWTTIPRWRKQSYVALACLMLPPVGLWLLWRGPTWRNKNGVISAVRRWEKVLITTLFVAAAFVQIATYSGRNAVPGELPSCDAPSTIRSLKSAVETSVAGRTKGLRLIEVEAPGQVEWNEEPQKRWCRGNAITNGGNQYIMYELRWLDRTKGRWLIEWRM